MTNQHRSIPRPTTLLMSLQAPARIHLDSSRWDMSKQVRINGIAVDGNDTPGCSLPDLLVDKDNGLFVGLTFDISDPNYWAPMREISRRLDPRVVRYNDISTAAAQEMYPDEAGKLHRIEILWADAHRLGCELAQLCSGGWFWWYAMEGNWGISPPVVALGLTDIEWILDEHGLSFPQSVDFPPLEVEYYS